MMNELPKGWRVKPLEWSGQGTFGNQPAYYADSAFGWLQIVDHRAHGNGFRVYPSWEETEESHPTLEAAKFAAQADYERRVMDALIKDMKTEQQTREIERLRGAVADMQGHIFFCQDLDGVLRRWYPPESK